MKAKSGKVTVSSRAKAKPVAKNKAAAKKPAAKPAAKKAVPAKKARPAASKPAAKKAVGKKPVAKKAPVKKVAAKKAAPKKVAPKKAAPAKKPVAKPGVKPVAKTVAKPAVKPATTTPAVRPKAAVLPTAPVAAPATAPKPAGADKTGRVSARLAQLTVPSMAPAVASTAAKASYLQTMPTTIAPTIPAPVHKDPKLANNWKAKPGEELTDAELLAMPDSEYMNDKQLAAFRVRLRQLRQDILNNAGETTEHLREDTVIVPDPADRATIEEEHALELRTRDRERKLLKKIEQSLALIDAGEYGYCDETGEPIGVARLLARPTATLSLEAQQRRELKQKMFGD